MLKFATEANLGKVVDNSATKVWCFGIDPINSMYDIRFAGGGNKFSQLCAFKFKSINPQNKFPYFSIAFVAKTRSKMYHDGGRNPSQWYIFKQIDYKQFDILDKQSCLVNYGFDVDKFFESDVFNLMLPKIKSTVENGIKNIDTFVKNLTNAIDIRDADKFKNSIIQSLEVIGNKRVNDKFYNLKVGGLAQESNADKELDEKIEQELKRKGIYADLDEPATKIK